MKLIPLLGILLCLAGCDNQSIAGPKIMTYSELYDYPVSCSLKDYQLKELTDLQKQLNYESDPDALSEFDRAYNSRLKSTIWWYAYRCDQS
jgi:hypothetical protein